MSEQSSNPSTISERISYLWWTVYGVDGTNGLRGTQQRLVSRVEMLEAYHAKIDLIWKVVQWLGLGVLTALGSLLSAPVAEIVSRLLHGAR